MIASASSPPHASCAKISPRKLNRVFDFTILIRVISTPAPQPVSKRSGASRLRSPSRRRRAPPLRVTPRPPHVAPLRPHRRAASATRVPFAAASWLLRRLPRRCWSRGASLRASCAGWDGRRQKFSRPERRSVGAPDSWTPGDKRIIVLAQISLNL